MVQSQLLQGRFIAALSQVVVHLQQWFRKCTEHHGHDKYIYVLSIAWNSSTCGVFQHVERLSTLISMCEAQGQPMSPSVRVSYIICSLEKANVTQFAHDLWYATNHNRTEVELLARLQHTASQVDMRVHFSEFLLRVQPTVRMVPKMLKVFVFVKVFTIYLKSNKSLKLVVVFFDSCISNAFSVRRIQSFSFSVLHRIFSDSLLGPLSSTGTFVSILSLFHNILDELSIVFSVLYSVNH
jgi:hypothetical protein